MQIKKTERPVNHISKDVYQAYVEQLLKDNPEWWSRYGRSFHMSNCYVYAKEGTKVVLKASWPLWKKVTEHYFKKAKTAIIEGEVIMIGGNVGRIRGCRIERNFRKKSVDWAATVKRGLRNSEGRLELIYHTSDDYCRVEWVKTNCLQNQSYYNFDIAATNTRTKTGFRVEFSEALRKNPLLKFKYIYHKIKRKSDAIHKSERSSRKCNTKHQNTGCIVDQ